MTMLNPALPDFATDHPRTSTALTTVDLPAYARKRRISKFDGSGVDAVNVAEPLTDDDRSEIAALIAAPEAEFEWPPVEDDSTTDEPEDDDDEDDEDEPYLTGWEPSDLAPYLDGTFMTPEPTVGRRDDSAGVFYAGRVNGVHGPGEGGKSWLTQHVCAQEIKAGREVTYIDYEDTEQGVTGRLILLGCEPEAIRERFHYIRPEQPMSGAAREVLTPIVARCSFVVIDATTESLAAEGLTSNAAEDIAEWHARLPKWIARLGPAVTLIDHSPKDDEARGNGQIGSQHKRSAITGVSYLLDPGKPFAPGRTDGRSYLRVSKDRPGGVRGRTTAGGGAKGEVYAVFEMDASEPSSVDARLSVPVERGDTSDAKTFAGKVVLTKVLEAADHPLSKGKWSRTARDSNKRLGSTTAVNEWMDELVEDGYVTREANGQAQVHTFVERYPRRLTEDDAE